ncbi:hypothetical protein KB20921_19870 [Edwardsiella ictaluri]|nr:hypothetical protein KH20906_19630 [Edwardsiella ictaluri]BEI02726.1 hypothetical protein KB20921_19870 [Edwardsiella ictaluri]BEI06191.1 hypothetical protein KH201010_19770 [Edwardsiella ictaluri]BEI09650.1 hypothetical protein STU22726_19810 [Edwardsiella ictaluri]BEI13128.1 hypothetical protein STU22816_19810 [Edwardsiella ictaluri]
MAACGRTIPACSGGLRLMAISLDAVVEESVRLRAPGDDQRGKQQPTRRRRAKFFRYS